ncbi:NAD-dependent deacylase [Roseovarius rhodophyticola]|uniref:NAD-dependent protein deacylase n=1 Tax=Roseovarius rhodophyticola TaxID=3080827 RepID=A0ABZ2TAZ1_9RHOB|nr:NAD-dependent deacylase [Roseovarius sp. W115]MDV2930583.1 NAD-dependent deacylase [Roseovarius sp. W115]
MKKVVILTGAGISAESGLGTFRDEGGLWAQHAIEDVATPEGFARNPGLVHEFYNARRAQAVEAKPNEAHFALARLEAEIDGEVLVITQNVDGMHEAAGSRNVIHMHGELAKALCQSCEHRWQAPLVMSPEDPCPSCGEAATRPDVVWFGEIPYAMHVIDPALAEADIFAAIGTSGQVYPAAAYGQHARRMGAHTVELNLEASSASRDFAEHRRGKASEVVPVWVEEILDVCGT